MVLQNAPDALKYHTNHGGESMSDAYTSKEKADPVIPPGPASSKRGGGDFQPYVVIAVGSPRKKGNSATLAKQVAAGASLSGAKVETFFLHYLNIRPCTACDGCRKKEHIDCVIQDDMQMLYPKLRSADAVVIASPIYWFTVSAQTKLFMDRWYGLGGDDGYALEGKRFGIVLAYGDVDPFVSGAVNALRTLQDALGFIEAEIVGMVYGSASKAGEIKNNKDLMDEAFELGKKLALGNPLLPHLGAP
jgi:multimeric flavodoxin WrbA